jgi:HK97 family phage prohead protease
MSSSVERRFLLMGEMPKKLAFVKTRGAGGGMKFKGYAARYSSQSNDLGGFREVLAPGAFDKVLSRRSKPDVVLTYNHNPDLLLARTSSGTLSLASDEKGLRFSADAPDTQLAKDLSVLIRRGDLTGASFAFTVSPSAESWTTDERGQPIRTIREVQELYDVSIVATPAYSAASVGVRALERWKAARGVLVPMQSYDSQAPGQAQGEDEANEQLVGAGLVISIDYDQTFTEAPGLWLCFIEEAVQLGNTVIMTTRRADNDANRAEVMSAIGPDSDLAAVIFAGPDSNKRDAARAAGYEVDVWIDDTPSTVDGPVQRFLLSGFAQLAASRALGALLIARLRHVAG